MIYNVSQYTPIIWAYYPVEAWCQNSSLSSCHGNIHNPPRRMTHLMISSWRNHHLPIYQHVTNAFNGCLLLKAQIGFFIYLFFKWKGTEDRRASMTITFVTISLCEISINALSEAWRAYGLIFTCSGGAKKCIKWNLESFQNRNYQLFYLSFFYPTLTK